MLCVYFKAFVDDTDWEGGRGRERGGQMGRGRKRGWRGGGVGQKESEIERACQKQDGNCRPNYSRHLTNLFSK